MIDNEWFNLIHYAGWPKVPGWVDEMTDKMREDLACSSRPASASLVQHAGGGQAAR